MFKCASPLSRVAAVCIGAGALFAATAASAVTVSIYKVIDADGRVTYRDTPPGATAGRVERRAFDLEANAMNFTRPRAVGSAPGGGSNATNNHDVISRLADELMRRAGVSVTRGSGSVVFSDQPTIGVGVVGGGEVSGIVTPSGNLVAADNATIGGTAGAATAAGDTGTNVGTGGGTGINTGAGNAGGGTGMGGGAGTGPAITNPSTGGAAFSDGDQTFTGNSPTFTSNSPTFTSNSPTFTSNSPTFSANTGTLGPATPGIGAGTVGATGSFSNADNGTATGGTQPGTPANPGDSTGTTTGSNGAAQTGVAPGANPFAGSDSLAPR